MKLCCINRSGLVFWDTV